MTEAQKLTQKLKEFCAEDQLFKRTLKQLIKLPPGARGRILDRLADACDSLALDTGGSDE